MAEDRPPGSTLVAAAKLVIPTLRRPMVPRPALFERLDGDHKLAVVSAPAGYGKTAVLASWAASDRQRVAWLTCDSGDVDPMHFATSLHAAIAKRWGVGGEHLTPLEQVGVGVADAVLAIAEVLERVGGPGTIVVDDAHLAGPATLVLRRLVDALPPGFRLVVGTRADLPFSLARLRVQGELLELRSSELRFDIAELHEFLVRNDLSLPEHQVQRLHDLVEGWPAGAQMAAIAWHGWSDIDRFFEEFAAIDRAVADFLGHEVLARQPPEIVRFLTETSVLEEFDADLCVAVTGRCGAAAIIDRLLAENLFVVALDPSAGRYRYHRLFRSFLRAVLTSSAASSERIAHQRASVALEERGETAAALAQALAIDELDRAAQILRAASRPASATMPDDDAAIHVVRRWLREFGASMVESDPTWVAEFLLGLVALTGTEDAPEWLEHVRRANPHADGELSALIELGWSEYHQFHGRPLAAIRHTSAASDAISTRRTDGDVVTLVAATAARARIQAGEPERLEAHLAGVLAAPAIGSSSEAQHTGIAAFLAADRGHLSRAASLARRSVAAADHRAAGRHDVIGRAFAGLAVAEVHLERNEDALAMEALDDVTDIIGPSRRAPLHQLVALRRSRAARLIGDEGRASEMLERAAVFADHDESIGRGLAEEAAEQALRFNLPCAGALVHALDPLFRRTWTLRVRLALIDGDATGAAAALAQLPPAATLRQQVESSILTAHSLLDRDVDLATRHVGEALAVARPEWLIRTLVMQGPDVYRLVAAYPARSDETKYVGALLDAAGGMLAPARVDLTQVLVQPLSSREMTVLRYLCSRLTLREIAAALYVSLNTLKSHVRSVYRKLDVGSRADAVDAGRRLGMI